MSILQDDDNNEMKKIQHIIKTFNYIQRMMQMIQFLHMQGDPFHFCSNVLNSEIVSIVVKPLLIEFHNLTPSYIKHISP